MSGEELLKKISAEIEAKGWSKKPFNIFNACGVEQRELTHSAFIANLLNPHGTHGCGNIFLQKFIDRLGNKENIDKNILNKLKENVFIDTEHHLGKHGRIDIWIKSKTHNAYLLIENKIYAGDQKSQASNYVDYLSEPSEKHLENRQGILLYLTTNGREASKESTDKRSKNDYVTISYYKDIKEWLNSSIVNLADKVNADRVVSAIHQYFVLLDYLNFKINLLELIPKDFIADDIKEVRTHNKPEDSCHYKEIEEILKYFEYKLKAK